MSWQTFFIFWVASVPFIAWRGIFEGVKVEWFLFGGIDIVLLWIVKLRNQLPSLLSRNDGWYLGWLGILFVSSWLGVHPFDSIIGGSYRHQGVLFFFFLWMIGKTAQALSNKEQRRLHYFIGIGVIVQAIIVILEEAGRFLFPPSARIHPLGTIGEPHALAGYFAVGFWFLFPFFRRKVTILPIIFLTLITTAVLFTRSKTGLLAIPFSVIGYGLARTRKNAGKMIGICVFILSSIVPIITLGMVDQSKLFITPDYENRPTIWAAAIEAIQRRPVLGYGAESGEQVFTDVFADKHILLDNFIIDRAHHIVLDILLWSGIIGLFFFTVWLIKQLFFLQLKKSHWNIAGLCAWFLYAVFQPLGVVHWIFLMVLVSTEMSAREKA